MIALLMGPSGSGKTTVGRALAAATGWRFLDADDLHPESNVEKIRGGTALNDADRAPWLERLHALMRDLAGRGESAVIACSALRDRYRRTLDAGIPDVQWVFLQASMHVLRERLEQRTGHFAGTAILADQLHTLEVPDDALVVDAEQPVDAVVQTIRSHLGLASKPEP